MKDEAHTQEVVRPVQIGDRFVRRGDKRKDICTVIDKHVTTNTRGEVIREAWLCSHSFLGQKMKHEECDATVRIGRQNLSLITKS